MPISKTEIQPSAVLKAEVDFQSVEKRVLETAPAPVSKTINTDYKQVETGRYKGRDFDAEARGKVACESFLAALTSPGLAGLSGAMNYDAFMSYVKKAADEMVAYTWEKQKSGAEK